MITSADKNTLSPEVSKYARKKLVALEAAAKIFGEKGFHGATTSDIASEMGIKQGSLYYYFNSKEQALQEVCEFGFETYVSRMKSICAKNQPFEAKILSILSSHLGSYRGKSNALKVHNDQRLYLSVERRKKIKKLGSQYRELLESVLQEGIEQGVVKQSVSTHFVAYSIIGICNSWGANLVREPELDLYDTIDQCSEFILYGVIEASNESSNNT